MPGKAEHIGTASDGRQVVRLLCSVGAEADGTVADKIHLLPGGNVVITRDSRMFQLTDPQAVINASEFPMLIDWEHNSEKYDGSTRAAGWIDSIELSDGSDGRAPGLWGAVTWTDEGRKEVAGRHFRYMSPVLLIDSETRNVTEMTSAALTNKPALRLQEISAFSQRLPERFGLQTADREETRMNPEKRKALCAAFSLADTASDDDILAAATKLGGVKELFANERGQLTAANAQVEQFRTQIADLQTQLTAAKELGAKAQRDTEINEMFQSNVNKIPPARVTALRAMFAKTPATFEAFKEFELPLLVDIGGPAPASRPDPNAKNAATSASVPETVRASLRAQGKTDEQINEAAAFAVLAKRRGKSSVEED